MSRKKRNPDPAISAAAISGGMVGRLTTENLANATDAMSAGMDLLMQAIGRNKVSVDILQGNAFEYIEATKFNVDAAIQRTSKHAVVTASTGNPTAPADIKIMQNGTLLQDVQAKSISDPAQATFKLSDSKYSGMQKVVPKGGQAERIRELADQRASTGTLKKDNHSDTSQNVTDRLHHDEVSSSGTTRHEAERAATDPGGYGKLQVGKQLAREMGTAALNAGVVSAIVGATMSAVTNGMAYHRREISGREAIKQTLTDGAKAGAKGAATGFLSAGIRFGATKLGLRAVAKANPATVIAASTLDIGASVLKWIRGEISRNELVDRVSATGTCAAAGYWVGAIGGAALGPAGAVAGSLAGYMVASQLQKVTVTILRGAKLAEEQARIIEQLSAESRAAMIATRQEFEAWIDENLATSAAKFRQAFAALEGSLGKSRPDDAIAATADLAALFGQELLFRSQEDFDAFMLTEGNSLTV